MPENVGCRCHRWAAVFRGGDSMLQCTPVTVNRSRLAFRLCPLCMWCCAGENSHLCLCVQRLQTVCWCLTYQYQQLCFNKRLSVFGRPTFSFLFALSCTMFLVFSPPEKNVFYSLKTTISSTGKCVEMDWDHLVIISHVHLSWKFLIIAYVFCSHCWLLCLILTKI